jgi:uncharacterized protein
MSKTSTKLLIASDTHGSAPYIEKCKERIAHHKPNVVFHLGDDYQDADSWRSPHYDLIRVPGTWTQHYLDPYIDNRRVESIRGWKIFLSHTPDSHYNDLQSDVKPEKIIEKQSCDLFLHGHTHRPLIDQVNGVWRVNPGHLKLDDNRGFPPTYAVAIIDPHLISITIYELEDDTVFTTANLAKMRS